MSSRPSQSRCPRAAGASMSCEVSRIADADGMPQRGSNCLMWVKPCRCSPSLVSDRFSLESGRTPEQVSHCRHNALESYGSDFWLTSALSGLKMLN